MSSSFSTANGVVVITQVYPRDSGTAVTTPCTIPKASSVLDKFLKVEPKALGTVQIMIGVVEILFGISMHAYISIYGDLKATITGITFWGALIYISSGALSVAANNKLNKCLVKGALGINIFSTITSGIAIILNCLDIALERSYYYSNVYFNFSHCICEPTFQIESHWMTGVLLVFSILEFIISICVSAFACGAVCDCTPEEVVIMQHPSTEGNTAPPENLQLSISTQAYEAYETISPSMAQNQPDVFIKSQQNPLEYVTVPP
ncbi:membrane-spanning 4-domains subfamily A member 4A-like [Anguilla anguilla]|nr:membrane-spanning 4-domains subfamily A member 4A-like [Anguilla anguilla]XP_035252194.1 membrane-spanning 4-domains subfamily A member 4A-like [Anguilla anguilla]